MSLVAGTNDFAGFQILVENTAEAPLADVEVDLGGFVVSSPNARKDRLMLLSSGNPEAFQNAMTELMAVT